jgi:transglutaminase-like putative cysteine protease
MVVGYLHELKPMDMHAWYEAHVGGRCYTFDATQKEPHGGRISLAYGRDAADVRLATQFGGSILTEMHIWVNGGSGTSGFSMDHRGDNNAPNP